MCALSEKGESLKKEIGLLLNEYDKQEVSLEEIYEILKEKMDFTKFCILGDIQRGT